MILNRASSECEPGAICFHSTTERDPEMFFRLRLAGLIPAPSEPDAPSLARAMADYVLFVLNTLRDFQYVAALRLPAPTDDVAAVLDAIDHPQVRARGAGEAVGRKWSKWSCLAGAAGGAPQVGEVWLGVWTHARQPCTSPEGSWA